MLQNICFLNSNGYRNKLIDLKTHKNTTNNQAFLSVFFILTELSISFVKHIRYFFIDKDFWMPCMYLDRTFKTWLRSCRPLHLLKPRKISTINVSKNLITWCFRAFYSKWERAKITLNEIWQYFRSKFN